MHLHIPVLMVILGLHAELVWSAALKQTTSCKLRQDLSEHSGYLNTIGLYDAFSFPFSLLSSPAVWNQSCHLFSLQNMAETDLSELPSTRRLQQKIKRSPTTNDAPSNTVPSNLYPTPQPTGSASPTTTVHITDESDFSLLLPNRPGELVSDAENDGVAFCTHGSNDASCGDRRMQDGFIRAAAIAHAADGSWIQVTGCIDPSKSSLDASDDGGQFDVRFPNGAQCTFGGYGASFIEQIEPSNARFCLRCCASANDQMNCNSHQDRSGCPTAIPGNYSFPAIGVDCS